VSPSEPFAKLVNGETSLFHSFSASEGERPLFTSLRVGLTNSFDFRPYQYSANSPNALPASTFSFTVNLDGNQTLGDPVFRLTFSSRIGWEPLELYRPSITGTMIVGEGKSFEVAVNFTLNFADRITPFPIWSNLGIKFGWDVFPGISLYGDVSYSRAFENGFFKDSFDFKNFGITFAFADEGENKPSVFISMSLRGTYAFTDNPNAPIKNPQFTFNNATYTAVFRPVFTVVFDECCYSVILEFDLTPKDGRISLSLSLPYGSADIVRGDKDGIRFPVLPLPFFNPIPGTERK
jgi:hypothetical protein